MQLARRQLPVRLSVLLAVLCAVFLLIGGAADAESTPLPSVEYVVAAGDTLWGIASQNSAPGEDLRWVIAEIREISGMTSSNVYPGQILRIPQG